MTLAGETSVSGSGEQDEDEGEKGKDLEAYAGDESMTFR